MQEWDTIRLEALDLAIGQSKYIYCPFCRVTHEAKCNITRTEDAVLFHCFRASCNHSGSIDSRSYVRDLSQRPKPKPNPPIQTTQLTAGIKGFLFRKFEIPIRRMLTEGWVYDPKSNRLHMPIRDIYGQVIGTCAKALDKKTKPKVLVEYTNLEVSVPIHFPLDYYIGLKSIVLVEDILSATKLSVYGIHSAAIVGTHLSSSVLTFLAKNFNSITLALDNDATTKAIKLKREYELYFRGGIKVVPMKVDPKDTDAPELRRLFLNGE